METPYAMGWNQPSMGKQQVATIACDLLFLAKTKLAGF